MVQNWTIRACLALLMVITVFLYYRGYHIPSLLSLGVATFLAVMARQGVKEAIIQIGSLAVLGALIKAYADKYIWLDVMLVGLVIAWMFTMSKRWKKAESKSKASKSRADAT